MTRSASVRMLRAACLAHLTLAGALWLVAGCSSSTTSGSGSGGNGMNGSTGGGNSGGGGGPTGGGGGPTGGGGDTGGGGGGTGGGSTGGGGGGGQTVTGAPITGNPCIGGLCLNPTCKASGTAAAIGQFPDTGFDAQPSFIPSDVIIPTFDDVPDGANDPVDPVYGVGSWTKADLVFFKANNMAVDMFINTNNWCGDVTMDPDCTATLVDILKSEYPANHTIHHIHMGIAGSPDDPGCADAASCDAELAGVESLVNMLGNGGRPHLTRFRAPYGEPFQAQGTGLSMAQKVVAKYAVQIGWNLDSGDSSCNSTTAPCFTGQDIANNVIQLVGTPGNGQRWGILLMHGTYPWTHDALPLLFGANGYLKKNGFRIGTVEDAICWKYGKHSWEIMQQVTGQARSVN